MIATLATSALAGDAVIHAGVLLDGVNEAPRDKVSILIHDDRISAIESGFITPAGAEVIDLSSETVMPGFIDCHVHIASKLPSQVNTTEDWLTHTDLDRAFDGAVFAQAICSRASPGRAMSAAATTQSRCATLSMPAKSPVEVVIRICCGCISTSPA
ncbi:MAG: hypothetical protein ACR2II_07790 [Chthoniobacterales bacterium]